MKLTLVHITVRQDGTQERSSNTIERDSVVFGRGSGCDVILRGNEFSLNHARVSSDTSGASELTLKVVLEDLDSLSGVTVNGQLIKRQQIRSGDEIAIGPRKYNVSIAGRDVTLTSQSSESQESKSDDPFEIASHFSAKSNLPSIRAVSWICIALTIISCLIYPFITANKSSWSAGDITKHHKPIEANCTACHDENFSAVSDLKCQKCHSLTDHDNPPETSVVSEYVGRSDIERRLTTSPHRNRIHQSELAERKCVSCHQEHNSESALIQHSSKLCIDCHATIRNNAPGIDLLNVVNWENHPKFFGTKDPADPARIKLNHKVHLQRDLRGPNGPVTLQCSDCHHLADDKRAMKPISRKSDCSACHSLTFEEKLPNLEVPHAPPDVVYQFLYAQYAQLLLAQNDPIAGVTRIKPGAKSEDSASDARKFAHSEVEQLARKAERELFTRTACKLCHEIAPASFMPSNSTDADFISPRSSYKILAPEIPNRWMNKAKFSHSSHDAMNCLQCHKKVEESELTGDVHMPNIEGCKTCHSAHDTSAKVQSDCVECHDYHESLELSPKKKADATALFPLLQAVR